MFFLFSLEAVSRRCSVKVVFLANLQNSQENTYARVSLLIKLQAVFVEISQNSQENTCARASFLTKLQADTCNFAKFLRTHSLTEDRRCNCLCFLAFVEIYMFHCVYMGHMSNFRISLGEVLLVE